jgi:outer membrane protein OmpA-like peptidoglycan-associated protein
MKSALSLLLSFLIFPVAGWGGDWTNCNQIPGARADFSTPCQMLSPLQYSDSVVLFSSWSSTITHEAVAKLDRQAAILRTFPALWIDVIGHVDKNEAATPEGLKLGYLRALAVRNYLIGQGVAAERISTDSHGDREVLPRTDDETVMSAMRFARTQTRNP